jgi:hypothetical protein
MIVNAKYIVQGEKLDKCALSHNDSIYTKLFSSVDVSLNNKFKRLLELIMTISIFSQIRLIINKTFVSMTLVFFKQLI